MPGRVVQKVHSPFCGVFSSVKQPDKVHWSDEDDRGFMELKYAICTNSAPHCPDCGKPFTLQTDASGASIGGVLLQEWDGEIKPVVFLNCKLLSETHYLTPCGEGVSGNEVGH